METIVLLAHGNASSGSFSNPKVKIITGSGQLLSDSEVRAYLGGATAPEFASSSLGSFGPVSDAECSRDLGVIPDAGPGVVDCGKRRGSAMTGYRIFVLRGMELSFAEVGLFAQGFGKVILLACRN